MSASARVPTHMSVAEFLAWNGPAGQKWQSVDGEPPANRTHGGLQSELAWVLSSNFRARDLPCVAVTEPGILPRALAANNVRIPDLAVTCSSNESEEATLSDPVLIVESLSPSNAPETWTNLRAYTSIPGVRQILVLHTAAIGADLLRRDADGMASGTDRGYSGRFGIRNDRPDCSAGVALLTTRFTRSVKGHRPTASGNARSMCCLSRIRRWIGCRRHLTSGTIVRVEPPFA